MKNIFKTISLLTIFILMFALVGCKEPHEHKFENGKCECGEVHDCVYTDGKCECGTTNIASYIEYFNKNLTNANYKNISYNKKIELNDVILLEELTTSNFNGSIYNITSVIKKLNAVGELEEDTTTKEDTEPTEITLQLKEEYFTEISINDKELQGKVKEDSSVNLINIQAKNIEIKITLNDQLKVSNITLSYTDVETNLNVSITVDYKY